jgi:DNA-binding transcriptional LysR family regulator
MRYTLRQLEVFLAVARTGSVSRAGDELGMSQSAVSGALADLERQFDVRLFDRRGKRVHLSDVGRALRSRAEAVWDEAHELETALVEHDDRSRLRVGATLTVGNYVAVPLMARFMRDRPGALVRLDIANTEEIARRVLNFELDVGLIEGELSHPELRITPFRDDELVVFAAPSHPLAKKRALTDDDLKRAQWIVRERGSGTRQGFDRAMAGILPDLHIALEVAHTEVIKRAVAAGLGLGCVSALALADELAAGTLKRRPVPHRDFRRKFYTAVHRQKHVGAELRRWLALL